jgi:dihydrofolate reductase
MSATYTWDVFCTVDGYGSFGPEGDWGGYWGKQGPELLERRLALYEPAQRLILGANTFREFMKMLGPGRDAVDLDPWNLRMRDLPTTVISSTLTGPFDWPDADVARGDATEVVARLKRESEVPLRSHGSLSLNRALMAAGLVDFVQVTVFPVVSGTTGSRPIFEGAADFDLDLVETRTLDGRTIDSIYRPRLHRGPAAAG